MNNIYERLSEHQKKFSMHSLNELFADNYRSKKYSILFEDIYFDFSKNFITQETLNLLLELAEEKKVKEKINEMFSGEKINFTENRAVLHTALRNFSKNPVYVDNFDIMPGIIEVREKMRKFVSSVHSGNWKGATGEKITDIVNIGIGGSHLGPQMVTNALQSFNTCGLRVHFVSNIDGEDIYQVISKVDLSKTIFIIASKTFTTLETMTNAKTAKDLFIKKCSDKPRDIANHFVALSTNIAECSKFGIPPENMFEFWDWVGGRFSLWSSIGLSIALAIGWENFEELLRGAFEIDRHFRTAPLISNIPVIFALLTVWYSTYWNFGSNAVIPYSHSLSLLPAFLQQLQMESNGKSVNKKGKKLEYTTGQVIWGEAGTNSQHSFFQLLHQGTSKIPVDFIGFIHPTINIEEHHSWLLSNMIAQAEALMKGKTEEEVVIELINSGYSEEEIPKIAKHKVFEGNRPSNMILIDKLTPKSLGKLIAIFEHKVFVEGIVWDINSFDQWGVELGKQLSREIYKDLNSEESALNHDSSTNGLIEYVKQKRKNPDKNELIDSNQ